jgi:hypothetical protein
MIIPILINTTALSDIYSSLDSQAIDDICDNIAKTLTARYASILEIEAAHSLHQTRERYIKAISVVDTGRLEGTVVLDYSKDPLIRMIEEGQSAFDLKDGLLNSQKAKVSKNGGRYITVPFRFGTPGAIGDSDVFSAILPQDVYDVVKNQETNISVSNDTGARNPGLTEKQLPVQYQKPAKRAVIKDSAGKVLFKEYRHKKSIYEGVAKYKDKTTGQNIYGSFRRVSDPLISPEGKKVGSDVDSWIHKGIEQYNLVSKALSNFNQETEIQVSLNNELKKLGLF